MPRVRRIATERLSAAELGQIRTLCNAAWAHEPSGFADTDWDHALGGVHVVMEEAGEIVAHASIVERELHVGPHRLSTGYVEAVATHPLHWARGYGSAVMREVADHIDRTFQLGALDTGNPEFYERLGWFVWSGPTSVRTDKGELRTPDEDGLVLVRLTPSSPELDPGDPISCDPRFGDVW